MPRISLAITLTGSLLFALASIVHKIPLDPAQAIGIVLGAWTTWLTAAYSLWNWPVGIASCLLFASVFGHSHLYGAMGMQIFYALVSVIGWRWWLRGGERGKPLVVAYATFPFLALMAVLSLAAVPLLTFFLTSLHDSSPALDSLATTLSAAAQYLVMRKQVQNWYFWIAADAVSVALYLTHHLPLMGAMYLMHGGMCAYGLWRWRRAADISAPWPSDPVLT